MPTPPKNNLTNTQMPLLEQRVALNETRPRKRKLRLAGQKWFKGTIAYEGFIKISEDRRRVFGRFQMDNRDDQVKREIEEHISLKFHMNYETLWDQFEITKTSAGDVPPPLPIKKRKMREQSPLNLSVNFFGNIVEIDSTDNNCVVETLTHLYPKIANQKQNPIPALKEATTEEVMAFCKKYHIRAIAYDFEKNVIAENVPEKDSGKFKTLVYLYYGNHMYLLDNKYLKERPEPSKAQPQSKEDLQAHFQSLLNQRIVPKNIKFEGYSVSSFQHNDIIYYHNPDYQTCVNIAKTFMFSDKIPFYSSLTSVMKYIEPLYTSNFAYSFLPINHIKPAFYYNKPRDATRDIETIDKNKTYSYVLSTLPYLLSTDFRTYECFKTDKFIDETCLYIAKPAFPNILMPKQDIYCGQHIRFCLHKFDFTITEVLKCRRNPNYYAQIVPDLYARFPDDAKHIINRTIGMFQKEPQANGEDAILITKEDRNPRRHSFEVHDDLYAEFVPNEAVKNLYNKKPIAIQVKDRTNQILYEKMEELNLTDDDIVQINTDSITFYKNSNLNLNLSATLDGWKKGEHNKTITASIFDNSPPFTTFFQTLPNDNTIITGYAGNGKSYHIQNKLDLTDAIILSSKHSAIRQHREKNFNAEVIQKFCAFRKNQKTTFPAEHHIIVEECGILTREHWDFLHKCVLLKKKLTLFGDFNQLLPVDEIYTFNRPQYINMIFQHQSQKLDNWRNNFTLEYYDSLINGDIDYLKREIRKYSTSKPEEADVIIAYRNTIVNKYNDYMLNYHNKTIADDDVPIMCITNDLRNHDYYNNFLFKSQEIPLTDEKQKELRTNDKYFRVAYARTLYNLQGDEVRSYYMAEEDLHWFANPRMAYTLISRLSTR